MSYKILAHNELGYIIGSVYKNTCNSYFSTDFDRVCDRLYCLVWACILDYFFINFAIALN